MTDRSSVADRSRLCENANREAFGGPSTLGSRSIAAHRAIYEVDTEVNEGSRLFSQPRPVAGARALGAAATSQQGQADHSWPRSLDSIALIDDRGDSEFSCPHIYLEFDAKRGGLSGRRSFLELNLNRRMGLDGLTRTKVFPKEFLPPAFGTIHRDQVLAEYARHSSLQEAMAAEALKRLEFNGDERVLDIGCGDGRLSARIADRLADGSVLGVDASADMIAFATAHYGAGGVEPRSNLRFEVADARALHYPASSIWCCRSTRCTGCRCPGRPRRCAASRRP